MARFAFQERSGGVGMEIVRRGRQTRYASILWDQGVGQTQDEISLTATPKTREYF